MRIIKWIYRYFRYYRHDVYVSDRWISEAKRKTNSI